MKKFIYTAIFTVLVLTSCKKDEVNTNAPLVVKNIEAVDPTWLRYPSDTIPPNSIDQSGKVLDADAPPPATTFVSLPDLNSFQAAPTSSIKINNFTYYGGPFQSAATSFSGSTVTFTVKRTDGLKFPVNSVIKIKAATAGGTELKSYNITTANLTSVSISVNDANTWNIGSTKASNSHNYDNYVLTWFNPASGNTFFTQPIKIVAVPLGWGVDIGNLHGVSVYSNGYGGFSATDFLLDVAAYNYSQKYQCVHFIQRYYVLHYGKNIGGGYAGDYWTNYTAHKFTQRVNNGEGTPQEGDVICFYKTAAESHVGIVNGFTPDGHLRVFEENIGYHPRAPNNNYCVAFQDFNYTKTAKGYLIKTDVLGDNWVTKGWVR